MHLRYTERFPNTYQNTHKLHCQMVCAIANNCPKLCYYVICYFFAVCEKIGTFYNT